VSGFDPAITEYICRKLREGVSDSTIIEEVTDSTYPLFISKTETSALPSNTLHTRRSRPWGSQTRSRLHHLIRVA
jgi:hypothetical protein